MKIYKKGFTLIEVIICLVIIGIISTISIVTLTSKKNWDLEKNIKKVISSADVYYNSNKKSKNDLIDNGGYLVLTVNQLREQGLLEDKLLVDGIDITKYKDSMLDNVDYEKILLSSRNEEQQVFLYYPLYGTPINYFTTKYIYVNDLDYNERTYDNIKNNYFDTVYFYNNDFTRLNVNSTDFDIGDLQFENSEEYIDIQDKSFNNLLNKKIIQKINKKDENDILLNREIYIYSEPQLIVRDLNKNNENNEIKDFGKWYNKVAIEITGISDDKEAYLNNTFTSNLQIFKKDNTENLNSENNAFYQFNNSGIYTYDYKFDAKSLENTKIEVSASLLENKFLKIDVDSPTIEFKENNSYEIKDDMSGISKVYCEDTKDNKINEITVSSNEYTYACEKKYVIAIDNAGNETQYTNSKVKSIDVDDIEIKPIKNSFSKFEVKLKNYDKYKDWIEISLKLKDYDYYSYQSKLNNYFNKLTKNIENNELSFEFDLVDVLRDILYYTNKNYGLDLYKNMSDDNKYNKFTLYVVFGIGQEVKKRYSVNYSYEIENRISGYYNGETSTGFQTESSIQIVNNDYFIFLKNAYGDCGYGNCQRNKYLYKISIDNTVHVVEIDKDIGDKYEYWYGTCFNNNNDNFGYTKVIKKQNNYVFYNCNINNSNSSCTKTSNNSDCGFGMNKIDKFNFNSYGVDVDENVLENISFIIDKYYYMDKKDGTSARYCNKYSFNADDLINRKLFIVKEKDYGIYFINDYYNYANHLGYIKFKLTPEVNLENSI